MSRTTPNSTLVAAVVLVFAVLVVGSGVLVLSEGGTLTFSENSGPEDRTQGSLTVNWVSDTARNVTGNHHVAVGGQPGGQPMIFAPISGKTSQGDDAGHDHGQDHQHDHGAASGCGLVALNGTDGATRWSYEVPPENCTIHAVADPTLADVDGDGEQEVLATSTERTVVAFDPVTGEVELEHNLSAYGYTRPLVADLTGDGDREMIAVDVNANVFVVGPDGEEVWTKRLPASYVWAQPHVDDFDGDGAPELAVALGEGDLYVLDGDGSVAWNQSVGAGDTVTWFTAGQADDDASTELVTATTGGNVSLFEGDGSLVWRENFDSYAAVEAVGDGDGDGTPEVYATARDGKLRALDGPTGEVE
jgi:outer membrane protein assembly factor BamB